ncbi:GYDIA family GHMP kinase [Winogradskyella endarachnes]|uniref:GHMP kinase n=1 Tax=Winogradskyella endarachnes TaxID=2681965 RepID=A0A6L6U958_9FLAO|nr:GYDIA family GHMP kinase [Winogradskyella endarachnes]MUU78835.1 GHMP kinase [Winogradskyella endarachnes]
MSNSTQSYRSNGKLLLTAEYAVLDGAKALAIPTKYGQSLKVTQNDSNTINWKSFNELEDIWFEDVFSIKNTSYGLNVTSALNNDISKRLIDILKATQNLNPEFLSKHPGFDITTHQDFNRLWGLGTSSTLINNIADWANVNAFQLLEKTFGGSGYDIACAQNDTPINFQLQNDKQPLVTPVDFKPKFKNNLYFVYLNQKQNSRDGISAYKKLNRINSEIISTINNVTEAMSTCKSLLEFEDLINTHETLIGNLIQQEPIKKRLFSDFKGAVKSLGAWGGDFVLVTSNRNPTDYFKAKELDTVISYNDMIL